MELISRKELAQKLDTSLVTIRRMEADGMPVMRSGYLIRYNLEEVICWMKENSKEVSEIGRVG